MKKIIFLALTCLFVSCAVAQTVTPRWGNSSKDDNTYRQLSIGQLTVTPTSTLVTIAPKSNYYNLITIASNSLTIPTFTANVTNAYFGDVVDIVILPTSVGTRTLTLGTNFIGAGTVTYTLTTSKQNITRFMFDGAKYQQLFLTQQP